MKKYGTLVPVLSLLIVAAMAGTLKADDENAKIVKLAGKTEIYQWGMWHEAREGQEVRPGESVRVVGKGEVVVAAANGNIEVAGKDDTTVTYNGLVDTRITPWKNSRLAKNPEYRADDDAPTIRQFYCPEGEVAIQVRSGERLNLVTPLVTASVRGTTFTMKVGDDASTDIDVKNGLVDAYSRITGKAEIGRCGKLNMSSKQLVSRLRCHGFCLPADADWRDYDYEVLEALDGYMFEQLDK